MSEKVVVITGASAGIGEALAEHLSRRGASLALSARRSDVLRAVAARLGKRAFPIVADVTIREEVERVLAVALERFGHIDVWVNNAGRGISRSPSKLTDADIDEMVQVNVKSALYGMQTVLPYFMERGEGHIINVSSLLGRLPLAPVRSAYSGAKHFLNALTADMRSEIQTTHPGIQISLVSPGVVATEFGLHARHGGADSRDIPGGQTPDVVAEVIAGVIESRRPDVYTRPGAQALVAEHFAQVGEDP